MHKLIQQWCEHMAAGSLTPATISLRAYHVQRAMRELNKEPQHVTRADLEHWLTRHNWQPATRRSYRASLRVFYAWAADNGLQDNPADKLPQTRAPRALPHPATDQAIMDALRQAPPRVQLMIELMAFGGLRRGEVATCRAGDLTGEWLQVTGKGGHTRAVPLPGHVCARIRQHTGWLFPGAINGHLSARRVGELVGEYLPAGVTAHSLRHRFATTVYARSLDIRAVQQLLGHARLDTTMIYVQVSSAAARGAAAAAWNLAA